jgi:hypothetical protein
VFSFGATKSPTAGELGCLVTRTPELHRMAVALTQHPTRQLLTRITCPRRDRAMARVAPVVALLGAHAIERHATQTTMLRQAAARVAARLRDCGVTVLSDPALHAPGLVAAAATPSTVWRALRRASPGYDIVVASVDGADLKPHPQLEFDPSIRELAHSITVVTLAVCHRDRRHAATTANAG